MAKNIYGDFKKKIDRIENHIAEEIAPQANRLFQESVRYALVDWYNDYEPQFYKRTNNFLGAYKSAKTIGKGKILSFSVDSDLMDSYDGWFGKSLQSSIAFDYMFMQGEHGHGKWMMHQSLPPYMYIERDIESGFGGRLDKIINNKIEEILRK